MFKSGVGIWLLYLLLSNTKLNTITEEHSSCLQVIGLFVKSKIDSLAHAKGFEYLHYVMYTLDPLKHTDPTVKSRDQEIYNFCLCLW